VLGIMVLREPVSFQSLAGFALAAAGVLLIATR
jgi:drug/metabolite transporter (DMT)-like permease